MHKLVKERYGYAPKPVVDSGQKFHREIIQLAGSPPVAFPECKMKPAVIHLDIQSNIVGENGLHVIIQMVDALIQSLAGCMIDLHIQQFRIPEIRITQEIIVLLRDYVECILSIILDYERRYGTLEGRFQKRITAPLGAVILFCRFTP